MAEGSADITTQHKAISYTEQPFDQKSQNCWWGTAEWCVLKVGELQFLTFEHFWM